MTISAAALPPIQPALPKGIEAHPLFPLYEQHRTFCSNSLIQAQDWEGFLYQYEQNLITENAMKDPSYPEFLAWCKEARSGARPCFPSEALPGGLKFPANFRFWQYGGRW